MFLVAMSVESGAMLCSAAAASMFIVSTKHFRYN